MAGERGVTHYVLDAAQIGAGMYFAGMILRGHPVLGAAGLIVDAIVWDYRHTPAEMPELR